MLLIDQERLLIVIIFFLGYLPYSVQLIYLVSKTILILVNFLYNLDQSKGFETETDSDGNSDIDQHESLPKFIEEHKRYNYITEKISKKSESVDCVLGNVLPDSIQHTSKTERIAISLLPDDISGDDPNINDVEFPLPSTRTQLYSKICNNFKKQNIKEMNSCEVTKPSLAVEEDLEVRFP